MAFIPEMELKTSNSRTKLLNNFYAPLIHHRDENSGGVKIRDCSPCKATAFMWGFNLFFFSFLFFSLQAKYCTPPPAHLQCRTRGTFVRTCADDLMPRVPGSSGWFFIWGHKKKQMMDGRNGQEKGWHPVFHLSGGPAAVSFMAEVTLYFYLNVDAQSIFYDKRSCSTAERIMH